MVWVTFEIGDVGDIEAVVVCLYNNKIIGKESRIKFYFFLVVANEDMFPNLERGILPVLSRIDLSGVSVLLLGHVHAPAAPPCLRLSRVVRHYVVPPDITLMMG